MRRKKLTAAAADRLAISPDVMTKYKALSNKVPEEYPVTYLRIYRGWTDRLFDQVPEEDRTVYQGTYQTKNGEKTVEVMTISAAAVDMIEGAEGRKD